MLQDNDSPEKLLEKQLEAIKERAIVLWGDKWLPQLVRSYAGVLGENERHRFSQVQRYFLGEITPSSVKLNALLMAVNCRFKMVCYTIEEKEI